jgi:FkbM family methyltransferase
MTQLSGKPISALGTLLKIRADRQAIQAIKIYKRPVFFRAADEQALREIFVDSEYAFLRDHLMANEEARILDIGAHIGAFAIWCRNVVPGATILSVEADPRTFEVLRRNAAVPDGSAGQWSQQHSAAGAHDGEILRLADSGPSMSHRINASGTVPVVSVSLKSLLDQVASKDEVVDLMKVDIEGSEEAFLCGCPDALSRVNALAVELHPDLCDAGRVEAMLRNEFDSVNSIQGRKSTKPLLFCHRSRVRHE